MPSQLVIFDETFREHDLTPLQFEKLEELTNVRWSALFTEMGRQARVLRRAAACLLSDRLGLSNEDALAKVDSLSMVELNGCLTDYDDDLPTAYENGFPPLADEG